MRFNRGGGQWNRIPKTKRPHSLYKLDYTDSIDRPLEFNVHSTKNLNYRTEKLKIQNVWKSFCSCSSLNECSRRRKKVARQMKMKKKLLFS